jgi:hypothetical protein
MSKISMIRGDSRNINVTFMQSDGVTPIDITGGEVWLTLNSSTDPSDDTSAALQKTVTSFSDPTNGSATISLAPSDTSGLAAGTYFYDVQLRDASGNILSSKQDKFVLSADVTRSTS